MTIEAVIGANYGDEGKGLFTDHLCRSRPNPIVLLSNGGCQRGHTVYDAKSGVKHVFHHLGSGTMAGAPSVFSKTFILNPIVFIKEKSELEKLGFKPRAFIAPGCKMQFPSDMFANQAKEKCRRKHSQEHGSCGYGIWETILRYRLDKQPTFMEFMSMGKAEQRKMLDAEIDRQMSVGLADFREGIDESIVKIIRSNGFMNHFLSDCQKMMESCETLEADDILNVDWSRYGLDIKTIVIENAQGLLLSKEYAPKDENGRTDIHATPSKTGFAGAIDALGSEAKAIANYVTRSYFTRHGAGPFPEHDLSMKFKDETNMPNDWQGSLKFGKFTEERLEELKSRIAKDSQAFGATYRLAVTHLNEVRYKPLEDIASYVSYDEYSVLSKV